MSKPFRISTRHVDDGWMDAWLKADGRSLYATTSMRLDFFVSLSLSLFLVRSRFPNRNPSFPVPSQQEERILCELVYNKPVVNSPVYVITVIVALLTEHEVRNLCFRPIQFDECSIFRSPVLQSGEFFPPSIVAISRRVERVKTREKS